MQEPQDDNRIPAIETSDADDTHAAPPTDNEDEHAPEGRSAHGGEGAGAQRRNPPDHDWIQLQETAPAPAPEP